MTSCTDSVAAGSTPQPVYVIHWNAPELCAATVAAAMASRDLTLAVVVIDNSPGVLEPETLDPTVEVVETMSNVGFAGAANMALAHCRAHHPTAERCVILAHDVTLDPSCLAALFDAMRQDPSVAVAGPRFGQSGEIAGGTWNGRRARWSILDEADWNRATTIDRDWMHGACLCIDSGWVDGHGGFESRLGSYVEDVELCLRVRKTGRRVVCVRTARAQQHARIAGDVTRVVDFNTMVVAAKHAGLRGLVAPVIQVGWYVLRGLLISLAPWRAADRRRLSRTWARQHRRALADVHRNRELIAAVVADPDRGTELAPSDAHAVLRDELSHSR